MTKKYVDPNKKHYFEKLTMPELKELFASFPEEHEIVMWEKGSNEELLEEFKFSKFDFELRRIFVDINKGFLNKLKGCPLENKSVGFRFNFDPYQYFSVSKLTYDKEQGLYFIDVLEDIYKAQQRKNYRINSGNGVNIELVIDHHILECMDISAGGTSVIVPAELDQHFEVGKEHKNSQLSFNNQTFIIEKLKLVKKFTSDETARSGSACYGVQFVTIIPKTEEALTLLVNNEARAKEIRKKMQEMKSKS